MSTSLLIFCLLALASLGWVLGVMRAKSSSTSEKLHSRRPYYGAFVVLWTLLPALAVLALWLIAAPLVVDNMVQASLPDAVANELPSTRSLALSTIDAVAQGLRSLTPAEIEDAKAARKGVGELLEAKGIAMASAPRPHAKSALIKNAAVDQGQMLRTVDRARPCLA